MELHLLKRTKRILRLEITNPDDTVIYPLISKLLKDERVTDARYVTGHPLLDKPAIIVRVKQGKPQDVVREAATALADGYAEMRKQVSEAPDKGA